MEGNCTAQPPMIMSLPASSGLPMETSLLWDPLKCLDSVIDQDGLTHSTSQTAVLSSNSPGVKTGLSFQEQEATGLLSSGTLLIDSYHGLT